ncbi:MAG: DoxX family protein [Nanoarchaeota archaeon]
MVALAAAIWAPLALRLVLGIEFLVHGYPKLFKQFKGTADFLAGLGFKPGLFWALVLGVTEFFGGLALLAGFASRVAAGLLIVSMLVATLLKIFKWKVPFAKGNDAGWEWDWLILGGLVALFLLGSGPWSVDQVLGWGWG